jgi:hypothetical protein
MTEVYGDTGTIQIGEQRWHLECYRRRTRHGHLARAWLVRGASDQRESALLVTLTGSIGTRTDLGIIYASQDRALSREQYLQGKEHRERERQQRYREAHGRLRRWHVVTLARLQHRLDTIRRAILDPLHRLKAFTGPRIRRWLRDPAVKVFTPKTAQVDRRDTPEFPATDKSLGKKLTLLVGVARNREAGELDPRDRDVDIGRVCRIIEPSAPDVAAHLYRELPRTVVTSSSRSSLKSEN